VGARTVTWDLVAAVGPWSVPWAPCGRRGNVAGPLVPMWPPWGRGRSPGLRVAAVGAWPVPCTMCGCRGGVVGSLAPCGRRGGVAGPQGPVCPPWERGRSSGPLWPPWGRGRSPKPREAAVGVWPVPLSP